MCQYCIILCCSHNGSIFTTFYDCWSLRWLISSSWYKPWWMEGIYPPPQPDQHTSRQPPSSTWSDGHQQQEIISQFAVKTPTDKLLCISQGRDHGPGGLRHIAGLLILNILFLSAAATWMLLYNLSCARPSQWRWWWWLLIRADGCSGGVTRADVGIHHVPVLQRCIQ